MENNLPSYSNDSNSNSNEQPQERNNQNASSQRNSNSNKNTSSNDNYRNSQFQTNTSSNMNFNTKVQCSANELREKGNCSQDILSNHKYPKKGKKSIRKTKTLMQSNYDSNNSSNQQKSSRDSYNLNYIIDTLTNKNMMPSNLNLNLNQEYHYKQNENSNYLKNYEINDRSIQSNNYLSNVCIPMQMGQPIMNTNQIPFNNYMNPNQLQNINPMYYQYPNSNHSNPMSIIPINNANALNNIKPQTIFLGTNMSQPNLNNLNQSNISLPNVSQPNMSNNYELVPNYMINQNPNNNSFQLVQVGMSLRPVSNFVMISTDKLASFPQNNGQNAPFYMHPVNNNVPLIPNANMVQQYNEKQNLNPSNKCV